MSKLGPYELNRIYTGDARLLSLDVPDNSVDLIFADPIWQNVDDYRWLAETAARVLKPSCSLITQAAHRYLPAIFRAVTDDVGVKYVWTIAEQIWGRNATFMGKR